MILGRCNCFILFLLVAIFGFVPVISASGEGIREFDTRTRDRIREHVTGKLVRIMPQLNKLNFGFGQFDGLDYYYTTTISRIFFQDLQWFLRLNRRAFPEDR